MTRMTMKITDYDRSMQHGRNCRVKLGKFNLGRGDKHVGVDLIMQLLEGATIKIDKDHVKKFIEKESKQKHDSRDTNFLEHLMKKLKVETASEEAKLEEAA